MNSFDRDKVLSFILIIIIIYISYDYCSSPSIEGFQSKYDKSQDKKPVEEKCSGAQVGISKSLTEISESCRYKSVSCSKFLETAKEEQKWNFGTPLPKSDCGGDKACIYKKNCMKCVQGSEQDSTLRRYLSGIGLKVNADKSSFYGYYLCDAMAAGCSDPFWYAYNKADWSGHDCKGVSMTSTHTNSTKMMCNMLTNPVLQFFMGFMGGITCTLKIAELEAEQLLHSALDKLGDIPGDMKDSICEGTGLC